MAQTLLDQDRLWLAVVSRDPASAAGFVYGVRSTRIYCRAGCPSRRPRRESVSFFPTPDAAEIAGYRECRRCRPRNGRATPRALAPVRRACAYIARHVDEPIRLADLSKNAGASPFHLQRTFTRLVGVSPRGYQEALRAQRFRGGLRQGADVSAAIYDAGYGSISRVYERRPTGAGMTPAEYRSGGRGLDVRFTIVDCPLGRLLVAGTAKGVCAVKIGDSDRQLEADLREEYPEASVTRGAGPLGPWAQRLVAHLGGRRPHLDLPLDVQATAFQWTVWRYLQSIPYGQTRSYSDVARGIGSPSAVRAVARACATNPVCLIVPCHRVVQRDGGMGGYRWGVARKHALLDRELHATRRGRRGAGRAGSKRA